jgi:NitT/TauT family transport system permease protein
MKKAIKIFLTAAILISIWTFVSYVLRPTQYLFPTPDSVFFIITTQLDKYFEHSMYTFSEVIIGFIIANAIGLMVAVAAIFFPKSEKSLTSLAVTMKTIPIIAIAPLLILWFGPDIWSKVAAVVATCFMPILVNVLGGAKTIDRKMKDLISLYAPNKIQELRFFILPGLVPHILSAFKISSSLAIVGALVSEFISANKGLGYLIISNYYSMNIAGVFACIIIASVFGILLYYIFDFIEKKKNSSVSTY